MGFKYHDYYQTLGVARGASQDEIQRAYRKMARQYHPDVNKAKGAEEKFKEISEAYEVLKDPDKRQRFDSLGTDWKQGQEFTPPPGYEGSHFDFGGPGDGRGAGAFHFRAAQGGASPFSDFFEAFFGRTGAGGGGFEEMFERAGHGGAGDSAAQAGTQEAHLTISLADAYHGAKKQIGVQSGGSGDAKTFDVKIPPGTTEGSTIRLKGQGGHGRGDLLLRVHIAPDPRFQLDGHNLATDLPVTPWEAALGAKAPVETFDGTVMLTIPPGTQSGQKLRLRGKGLPHRKASDGQRGDLLVRVNIVVPTELNQKERDLLEALRKESKFNPRK